MIRRWNDYDTTKSYSDVPRLPKGGYVCKIMGAVVENWKNGPVLKVSCDIAEGEYAGFYAAAYKANTNEDKKWSCNLLLNIPTDDGSERDGWSKRSFKTFTEAVEDSNAGYAWNWDERSLKGLMVGGLFNEREYLDRNNQPRMATNLARCIAVDKIRSGDFKLPDDKFLDAAKMNAATGFTGGSARNAGFMDVPAGADDEGLPFA